MNDNRLFDRLSVGPLRRFDPPALVDVGIRTAVGGGFCDEQGRRKAWTWDVEKSIGKAVRLIPSFYSVRFTLLRIYCFYDASYRY